MHKNALQAIILAAGRSTRFQTGKTKLVEKICGQPMILFTTKLLAQLQIPTTAVVGFQKDEVIQTLEQENDSVVAFTVQEEQHGTAHAIACSRQNWHADAILIMSGDMPLVTEQIIEDLHKRHAEKKAAITFVIAHNNMPLGASYGRLVQQQDFLEILEDSHATLDRHEHCCINAGIYIFDRSFLEANIDVIARGNNASESCLTELIRLATLQGKVVETVVAPFDVVRGINNFEELWAAEQIKRSQLMKYWMERGVRFTVPQTVHIDVNVSIGAGTCISSGAYIGKGSTIGKHCTIGEFSIIEKSIIEDNVTVYSHSVIKNSHLQQGAKVGPFAHIRDHTLIATNAVIGNFVEVKKSFVDAQTKIKHLSFIGDAQVGKQVNIGAGTITCNYDGKAKHATIIKDNVFVGSNNTLIAPVTLEEHSFTAAGSVITEDVPAYSLAIARSRQSIKPDYIKKKKNHEDGAMAKEGEPVVAGITKKDGKSAVFIGAIRVQDDSLLLD